LANTHSSTEIISVIVPLFNEEDNVKPLCLELNEALNSIKYPYEVIFIDDGSNDKTSENLSECIKINQYFQTITLSRNSGQTQAIMAGIDHSIGDIIVPIDGDLQNDPSDIEKLLKVLKEGCEVASGWRKDRKDAFWTKILPSKIANALISWISGVKLKDYGCTLKAYKREVLKGFRLYGEMHRFVPIYAHWQGARIKEVIVNHRPRKHGKSNYGLTRIFKVLLDLLVVKFLTQYHGKPIYIFGIAGFSFFLISLMAGCWAIYLKLFENTAFIETPLPLLFTLGFITGVMCILMGLLAEILVRIYYETLDKKQYNLESKLKEKDT
jgi:dolichol-phosphate mannosyltransferase